MTNLIGKKIKITIDYVDSIGEIKIKKDTIITIKSIIWTMNGLGIVKTDQGEFPFDFINYFCEFHKTK